MALTYRSRAWKYHSVASLRRRHEGQRLTLREAALEVPGAHQPLAVRVPACLLDTVEHERRLLTDTNEGRPAVRVMKPKAQGRRAIDGSNFNAVTLEPDAGDFHGVNDVLVVRPAVRKGPQPHMDRRASEVLIGDDGRVLPMDEDELPPQVYGPQLVLPLRDETGQVERT